MIMCQYVWNIRKKWHALRATNLQLERETLLNAQQAGWYRCWWNLAMQIIIYTSVGWVYDKTRLRTSHDHNHLLGQCSITHLCRRSFDPASKLWALFQTRTWTLSRVSITHENLSRVSPGFTWNLKWNLWAEFQSRMWETLTGRVFQWHIETKVNRVTITPRNFGGGGVVDFFYIQTIPLGQTWAKDRSRSENLWCV